MTERERRRAAADFLSMPRELQAEAWEMLTPAEQFDLLGGMHPNARAVVERRLGFGATLLK